MRLAAKALGMLLGGLAALAGFPIAAGTPADHPIGTRSATAVDRFAGPQNGSVYHCWTESGDGRFGGALKFARSHEGRAVPEDAQGVSIADDASDCSVVISPNHQVSVIYRRAFPQPGANAALVMRRSLDGGANFTGETRIAELKIAGARATPGRLFFAAANSTANRGFLYVAFEQAAYRASEDGTDIYLTYSVNGGASWSEPSRVNDDTAGDQYAPTIAVVGERIILTYLSGSQDAAGRMEHLRGRLGKLTTGGGPHFNRSFQLDANTKRATNHEQLLSTNHAFVDGDSAAFTLVWRDRRQDASPDEAELNTQSRRILAAPEPTDLRLASALSARQLKPGQQARLSVTASAAGGPARDVFLSIAPVPGVQLRIMDDRRCVEVERFIGCELGTIMPGGADRIDLAAIGRDAGEPAAIPIIVTTSSLDTRVGNEQASQSIEVLGAAFAPSASEAARPAPSEATLSASNGGTGNTGIAADPQSITATLGPIADTYVDQTQKNLPRGSEPFLAAKNASGFTRHGYVKFDTSGFVGSITSATLRITLLPNGGQFTDAGTFTVNGFADNSWSEASTWNTRPTEAGLGGALAYGALPVVTPRLMEIDVTDFVMAQKVAGSSIVSFTIRASTLKNSGVIASTREGEYPPELVLTGTPPPPSCTLTAEPGTVANGGGATLSWTASEAASLALDAGIGFVQPVSAGSIGIRPAATTTFTALATREDGTEGRCEATVTVVDGNTSPTPMLVGQTPANPVPLSPPPIAGIDGPYELVVSGTHAFVTNERLGSFAVIDISDPANPTFVAESPRPGINARGLAIEGSRLYLTDMVDDSISVFDISNPAIPLFISKLKDSTALNGARSIAISGDHAFVANTDGDSLTVIDLSDELQPSVVASTKGPTPGVSLDRLTDLVVSGGYAYVASSGAGGLAILDASVPENPVWVSAIACPGGEVTGVHGVKVVGSLAFVACAGNASFGVIDVSDPAAPAVIGWTRGDDPGATFSAAFHLFVLGDYAYVTLSDFDGEEGKVVVVDISDPADPRVAGETQQIREARAIFAEGRYLYTASDAWDSVMIFDVGSSSDAPSPACTLATLASTGQGEPSTLSWTSTDAAAGIIDPGKFGMNPVAAGSATVSPQVTTTFSANVVDPTGRRGGCAATMEVVPAPENIVTLSPVADTFVSQAASKTSYGSTATLMTKTASSTSRHAYLKFDTSGFEGPVLSAKLRLTLFANEGQLADPGQFSVFEYLDSSWSEATTWNTRPPDSALGGYLGSRTLPVVASETIEIDVSHFINRQHDAGSPVVSFSVRSYGAGGVLFGSRESTDPPELVLVRAAAGSATPNGPTSQNALR